ncbi:hypothetical protein CEXT_247971 [Caerostris extrusa]|uniref:Uncharacterized protein n=1 Tax=Caerostris extrusa TaxID=172846 RepID=A0AAV4VQ52_CAEEX|nr:hypothetical protein CEXT_247971 [Caerostris extrusa]
MVPSPSHRWRQRTIRLKLNALSFKRGSTPCIFHPSIKMPTSSTLFAAIMQILNFDKGKYVQTEQSHDNDARTIGNCDIYHKGALQLMLLWQLIRYRLEII